MGASLVSQGSFPTDTEAHRDGATGMNLAAQDRRAVQSFKQITSHRESWSGARLSGRTPYPHQPCSVCVMVRPGLGWPWLAGETSNARVTSPWQKRTPMDWTFRRSPWSSDQGSNQPSFSSPVRRKRTREEGLGLAPPVVFPAPLTLL
ncbi:hypothetical protein Cadr_000028752 [Camelus dromedarius]|uniref:Uncharacterized protein n=1 Tax=Camelus dromedarius TaxID=9838 RepID=A0A5N4C9F6_CAMDR|nr:hypothetical protein Cadr_000028752 [Camelus dromedarius]